MFPGIIAEPGDGVNLLTLSFRPRPLAAAWRNLLAEVKKEGTAVTMTAPLAETGTLLHLHDQNNKGRKVCQT